MLNFLKSLFVKERIDFSELIKNGALIVDVRTSQEFSSGHAKNARNIPLQTLDSKINSLKKKSVPIITCCASGIRSGKAAKILNAKGIEAYNAGPWKNLKDLE